MQSPHLCAVHLGLPCGTSSRARERPISATLKAQGVPQPPPLRSAEFPLGLPGLSDFHNAKVTSANDLYALAIEILVFCAIHNIIISVENPASSWLWACLVLLARRHSQRAAELYNALQMTQFHTCCHGGSRRKHTGWLGTFGVFSSLEATCQNDHPHEPWGVRWMQNSWVFDTSSEAAYPTLLAQRIAACLATAATHMGYNLQTPTRLHDKATAVMGRQSKRHKPLLPEYHHVKRMPVSDPLPEGTKLLAPHLGGKLLEEVDDNKDDVQMVGYNKVGFLHTPKQFLSMAKTVSHPMDSADHLEQVTRDALDFLLRYPQHLVEVERKKNLLQARLWSKQLEQQEKDLHSSMEVSLEKVLKPKKLLLWEKLLQHYGYDDMAVVELMTKGVSLVGMHDSPECYPPLVRPATLTESDLRSSSVWRRKAIVGKNREHPDPDHINHLEETATDEVAAGYVEGPFHSEKEVSEHLGSSNWSVIRRFVLVQGAEQKLRPIDDCLEAQLNFAYTSTVYLKLQDIDYVAGLALKLTQAVAGGNQKFGSGRWVGKCLDLSKAYKQLAVRPEHRDLAVIFFHDAHGAPKYFVANSLMFGSTAAVYAFNRVSRSLWFLFNKMLIVPCGVFYDDYPLFSPVELAQNTDSCVSELLDLLGWGHARTGPKGKPFHPSFQVLGCVLDLSGVPEGQFVLENKPGRVDRICDQLAEVKLKGAMGLHQAQVLHGLLRYACGFFAGRYLHPLCAEVMAFGSNYRCPKNSDLGKFCSYATSVLRSCKPRVVKAIAETRPILVFTDGAWEAGRAGVGAVVVDVASGFSMVYSGTVPDVLVERWRYAAGEQIICQIELYALVSIRWHLQELFCNRRVIFWIDNEAARFSTIKCLSPSPSMNLLVKEFYALEIDSPMYGWIERVPSYSNVADGPSRASPNEACAILGIKSWESHPHPRKLVERLLDVCV